MMPPIVGGNSGDENIAEQACATRVTFGSAEVFYLGDAWKKKGDELFVQSRCLNRQRVELALDAVFDDTDDEEQDDRQYRGRCALPTSWLVNTLTLPWSDCLRCELNDVKMERCTLDALDCTVSVSEDTVSKYLIYTDGTAGKQEFSGCYAFALAVLWENPQGELDMKGYMGARLTHAMKDLVDRGSVPLTEMAGMFWALLYLLQRQDCLEAEIVTDSMITKDLVESQAKPSKNVKIVQLAMDLLKWVRATRKVTIRHT